MLAVDLFLHSSNSYLEANEMGLCKCQKRKVTNLFCFEHDVNVCEYCLVADHERCIVQSYVQWLQDSEYNPICILCKNLLKEEPTVRLICYDVFHWSCLDKYAASLPANTAPAGYQCPKCKECLFPPQNLVSPVVEALRAKLETVQWSRIGLSESLVQIEDATNNTNNIGEEAKLIESVTSLSSSGNTNNGNTNVTDEESNGYIIVKQKNAQQTTSNLADEMNRKETFQSAPQSNQQQNKSNKKSDAKRPDLDQITPLDSKSHIRSNAFASSSTNNSQFYDSSLGVVLNIDNLDKDRDTGDFKYQRRPLFEWLSRWLRSRQINSRRFRMTRQKKILFLVILVFLSLFTLIVVFSRLGSMNTDNDPALDPMNNPNIRVQ